MLTRLVSEKHNDIQIGEKSRIYNNPKNLDKAFWGFYLFLDDAQTLFRRIPSVHIHRVFDLPAFNSIYTKRCLIPVTGMVVSRKEKGRSKEYIIEESNGKVFCIAGIWEKIMVKGELVNTFLLMKYDTEDYFLPYIKRIPLILEPEYERTWLNYTIPAEQISELISPPEEGFLKITPV